MHFFWNFVHEHRVPSPLSFFFLAKLLSLIFLNTDFLLQKHKKIPLNIVAFYMFVGTPPVECLKPLVSSPPPSGDPFFAPWITWSLWLNCDVGTWAVMITQTIFLFPPRKQGFTFFEKMFFFHPAIKHWLSAVHCYFVYTEAASCQRCLIDEMNLPFLLFYSIFMPNF